MNKFFVFGWISLAAILIVENMVVWMPAYVFINPSSKTWILSFVSIIIWIFIWFWLKWMLEKNQTEEVDFDF